MCGIQYEDIQRKLQSVTKLNLVSAMDVELAGEAASRQTVQILGSNSANFLKMKKKFRNKVMNKNNVKVKPQSQKPLSM